jgi:hypothetical protein
MLTPDTREAKMATWKDVVGHLKANFNCNEESAEMISIIFDMGDDRSQIVFIERAGNDKIGEFASISSAVGTVKNLSKLEAYCREARSYVSGGIVITGDYIMVRDTFPLLNLDVNELEVPLLAIVSSADQIESEVTGGDAY